MPSYNLYRADSREELRAERQAELTAVIEGRWPRNLDDFFRWSAPASTSPAEYAARMCRGELAYLAAWEASHV